MRKYYLLTLQVMMLLFVRGVFAVDDKTSHPAITESVGWAKRSVPNK